MLPRPANGIVLQFSRQADLASDAIAWFTQGRVSHVDAVMDNGFLFGARSDKAGGLSPGAWPRPPNYAPWAYVVRMERLCTLAQKEAYWRFLRAQTGKPYDHSVIWGFATGRDWRAPDSWVCSELQAAAAEVAALFLAPLFLRANKISPTGLGLAWSAAGGRVIYESGR